MKKILSLILVFAMFCTIIFCMSSCSSNSDVVGVWKLMDSDMEVYLYIYSDKTADQYTHSSFSGWHHGNVIYNWSIRGNKFLLDNGYGNPERFTFDQQYFYDAQGNIEYKKINSNPAVDLY